MASGSNQYEGAGTKTVNMFSKLVSHGSNFVMEGVKNLVIKRHVSYWLAFFPPTLARVTWDIYGF
jgi:hypothetical protein